MAKRGGYDPIIRNYHPYVLESFFYVNKDTERLLPSYGDFLLDSGAFTFMSTFKNTNIDWDAYIHEYGQWIIKNNVSKFFELDIDAIVGHKEVLKYREKLETMVERRCIPVWHKSRGFEEYIRLCDTYNYIAIGGIAIKTITKKEFPVFTRLLHEAHERGTKVHGLGMTQFAELVKYRFDSVDSSAWTAGNRFGFLYVFDGTTMRKVNVKERRRIVKPKDAALWNYVEWVKFQKYAEQCL